MLWRKLGRDIRQNFGQFLSIFLLALLAVAMYATFEGNVVAFRSARESFHEDCRLSDLWVYSEGFEPEQLEAVRALDFVEGAQLRTSVSSRAVDYGDAQIDLYLMMESEVNLPCILDGAAFDLGDKDGVWLAWSFADAWGIQVGAPITLNRNGVSFTKTVRGLIAVPEYEFSKADSDADTNFKNIGYVYMAYDAFPVRDYVEHMIRTGKLSVQDILEDSDLLDEVMERLDALGLTVEDLTQERLLERIGAVSDEKLFELMPYTTMVIRTRDAGGLAHEDAVAASLENDYAAIVDAKSIIGLERVDGELEQHEAFSAVFALLFVIIALLVIVTSMSRMVEAQRTQIGTLNAIGVTRGKILLHYLSFSTLVAALGGIAGFFIGVYLLEPIMVDIFGAWYIVPGLKVRYDYRFLLVAMLVTLACVLGAFLSCRKLLRIRPAEALRPGAPKKARRCLWEYLPCWNKLGFNAQYNLRDLSRAKLRAVMGLIGTAAGMMMVLISLGVNGMLDSVYDWQFEKIQHFDYELVLGEDQPLEKLDSLRDELDGELVMMDAVEIAKRPHATGNEKSKQTLTVIEGKGFYNLTDSGLNLTSLTPGSIAVTRRLAEEMDIRVGDTIYWHLYDKNDWYGAKVGVINRTPETSGISMLREDLEAAGCEFTPSLLATDINPEAYRGAEGVTAVYSMEELLAIYQEGMEVMDVLVAFMLIFSVILVVVVLYNSGNLSFYERTRELATLRVMGFNVGQLRRLLGQQNLWIALVGVLLGAPLGRPAVEAMANSNGANFDYYIQIPLYAYFLSALFVLLVSVSVSFLFSRKLKKLDMVSTLKSE